MANTVIRAWFATVVSWFLIAACGADEHKSGTANDEVWWAFRPLNAPAIPTVRDNAWVHTPVDAFILAKLESKSLKPSPPADRQTLIRRLTYDLHGLPPTPEETDAFVSDQRPDAYEQLIDRLLSSPRYGERWGRHWLDVVHYGDTHGYDKDKRRDRAWPYRDYVIRAFNDDKPYGEFIREQLAGDVLYPDRKEGVIATGFIAAGPWDFVGHVELREDTIDKLKTQVLDRDDMVTNTFSTFQSLTVGCARCHDHKFDPIPQAEYYRLQAVFAGVERGDRPYPGQAAFVRKMELEEKKRAVLAKQAAMRGKVKSLFSPEIYRLGETAQELADIERRINALPPIETVYSVVSRPPRPIHRLLRGNVEQPRDKSEPAALSCLPLLGQEFLNLRPGTEGGRRAALADWIADRRNPLTWRSIVNRVWHYHFGRGIVDTPNDFGANGSQPTHPELLDWLAAHFRKNGQSIKELHRLILTSSVYRQSSHIADSDRYSQSVDADNRLLWRMNRQRLDAESVRDVVLAVSGKLDFTMGGPGFELFRYKDDHSPTYDHDAVEKTDQPNTWRRTVYRFVVRSVPNPFLDCLDCADPNINTPVRNTTLTALQALALLNDPFVIRQSEFFSRRLKSAHGDVERQVALGIRLAFGRAPTDAERALWASYVEKHGLANACRLIFNTNEFVFVD